jgi:hypothetical protein
MVGKNPKHLEWHVDTSEMAERVGFEPTIPETGMPDFESGAFDHSATSPEGVLKSS